MLPQFFLSWLSVMHFLCLLLTSNTWFPVKFDGALQACCCLWKIYLCLLTPNCIKKMSLPIKMAHTEIVGQVTRDSIPTVCSVASCFTSTSILTTRSGDLCVHSVPAITYLQKGTNMIKQLNLLTLYLSEIGILSGPSTDRVNDGNSSIYSKKDLPLQQKMSSKSFFAFCNVFLQMLFNNTLLGTGT